MNDHIEQLKKYIQEQLNAGFTREQIRDHLHGANWSKDMVQQAFDALDGKTAASSTAAHSHQSSKFVPSAWPGAFGIYKLSRDAVRTNIWLLICVWIVSIGITIGIGLLRPRIGLLSNLLSAVVSCVTTVMVTQMLIAGTRGRQLTPNDLFPSNLPMLAVKLFALGFIVGAVAFGSMLALIVPFFFVYPRLLLAQYFLVDEDMGPIEAFSASWHATKGNIGKVWGITGAGIAFALLFFTIIGIPFAFYFLIMYSAAYAILYGYVLEHQSASVGAH